MVVTEWNEFRALDLNTLKGRMRGDVLVDLRNIYLPAQARAAGLNYTSIGQGKSSKSIDGKGVTYGKETQSNGHGEIGRPNLLNPILSNDFPIMPQRDNCA